MATALLARPTYEVRLAGVVVTPLFSSFKISETLNSPDTLLADVASVGAPYLRPSVGQSVIVTENGVRVFGGTVTGVRERGLVGPSATKILVEVQATSYEINAARRLITRAFNETGPTDTIGSALAILVAEYYAAVGVTLHPAQTAGPVLPAATFERVAGDVVNQQLAASVGYLQTIDFENRLRAWAPGEIMAPHSYDELVNPELLTGDIEVERGQLQSGYANRVILTGDPIPVPDFRDTYVGDGVTNSWPVTYKVNGPYPNLIDGAAAFGIVFYPDTNGGASGEQSTESLGGVASPMIWKYDALANTISRSLGPVPAGQRFEFPYHGLFIPEGMAEDAAEIAQYGLWEHIEVVTAVTTGASAQAYAEAVLAAKIAGKEEIITLYSRELGWHPGQLVPVSSPSRVLTGAYLITQVETQTEAGSVLLLRTITASKSLNNSHDWRRVYQQWALGGSSGTSTIANIPSTPGGGLHGANHQLNNIDPIPGVGYLDAGNTWRAPQTIPVLAVTSNLTITPPQFRVADNLVTVIGPVTLPQTIPALPPNIAFLDVTQTFTGAVNTFSGIVYCSGGYIQTNDIFLMNNRLLVAGASAYLTFDVTGASRKITITGDVTLPQTGMTLPPNLAYTNVNNNFSVTQTMPSLDLILAGSPLLSSNNTANGVASRWLSYVDAIYFGSTTVHPVLFQVGGEVPLRLLTDMSARFSHSVRIGNLNPAAATPLKALHVGTGQETPVLAYPGAIVQSAGDVAQVSGRYCSGGGASVDGGFFVHPNGTYIGTWTNHPAIFRTNNLDAMTIGTDKTVTFAGMTNTLGTAYFTGTCSIIPSTFYVGGFAVTVTASCSIPSTGGGGVELPPNLVYANVNNPWASYQSFQGISFNGHDLDTWLNQPVRMDSTPTFNGLFLNGGNISNVNNMSATSYSVGSTPGASASFFIRAVNNASIQLTVVGGIVTSYQLQ